MPKYISFSTIFCGVVLSYIIYSMWSICQIFIPPKCTNPKTCLKSYLHDDPDLDLCIFISQNHNARGYDDIRLLEVISEFEYTKAWERKLTLDIPENVRKNGSLNLHVFAVPSALGSLYERCSKIDTIPESVSFRIPLTQMHVPESYIFNLLENDEGRKEKETIIIPDKKEWAKPVSHLKSKVTFNMLTDPMLLPREKIPVELYQYLTLSKQKTFLPILIHNFLETKIEDLRLMQNPREEVLLKYEPIHFGKLRFILNMKEAMTYLKKMGFTSRDIDDIKGIFAGTNLYLLSATMVITTIHVLFDILAFKNDIKFWRQKKTVEGLSVRFVIWRAFSQAIVCLYLLDEQASLLVLIPSVIATTIEFWKVIKVLRRQYSKETLKSEIETNKYDAECMTYISYILYPLCVGGAMYSLLYQQHRSWYSWCIHSLVNGVYAFGFLFMLPQLFINYRLKSVEALPWRAFMYKAFNTFIDDFFAFIITMPTAHRVACFRDDVIFLVYLYQRWLYPVDKTRRDESTKHIDERGESKDKTE
ncbi:UNVERIFIED_CONTAM: hypothetical protein PYX00_001010 [Menopon gallinae]|uniref:Lipid scramblase CLPTM1L n=1 Tax=Menopon gallinae TaxID=328185 RepID=A0AAW2ICG8_9NEOP